MVKQAGKIQVKRIKEAILGALFFFLMVFPMNLYVPDCLAAETGEKVVIPETAGAEISADLAWAESDGNDYEIFTSHYDGNTWLPKVQVTDNSANDIVPAAVRDNNGDLWVVWSRAAAGNRDLYFRSFNGQKWAQEKTIETGFAVNLSAALAVDRINQIWLVWVSFDGVDDDIFFSRWDGAGWSSPMRVNTDDSTPDIQPVIGIGPDGLPWVRWSGFEDGDYREFESRWDGNDWGQETMLPESNAAETDQPENIATELASSVAQQESLINARPTQIVVGESSGQTRVLPLPDFLGDPWKAGICIENSGKVTSQPLRTLFDTGKTQ